MSSVLAVATLACSAFVGHSLDLARYDTRNGGLEEVPQDLGEYNFWTCTGEGEDRSCEFNDDEAMTYGAGVSIYGAANFVGMVVVLLCILLNISCHLASCCCSVYRCFCKKNKEVVPGVGPNGELVEPHKQVHDHKGKYTRRDLCRITSFVFVIIGIPLWCILGMTLGADKLAENSSGLVNAPSGVKDFIMYSEPVASRQLISQVGGVLVPLVEGMDDLIQNALDFDEMIDAVELFNASLVDFPQVQTFIDMGFEAANLTTDQSKPIIDDVLVEMGGLRDIVDNVTTLSDDLKVIVVAIGDQNTKLSYELGNTSIVIADLRVLVVELVGDGGTVTGAVSTISSDLGVLPAATDFDTAAASVATMSSSGLDGNPSAITSVSDDCTTVYTELATLPNYALTAGNLTTINDNMASMSNDGGSFDQLTWRLGNISAVVGDYPSFSETGVVLASLEGLVKDVDIAPLIADLGNLLDLFNIVPEWIAEIDAEIQKTRNLIAMGVNVTQSFTKQLLTVNATIMGLPDNIMDVYNYTFGDEFTVQYLTEQLDNITDTLADVNETVVDFLQQGNDAVDSAADFSANLTSTLDNYNITSLIVQLDDADASMAAINFTEPLNMIAALRSDIANFTLDPSFVAALEGVQTYFDTLNPLLQRVIDTTAGGAGSNTEGDFLVLAKGYCSGDGSINNCEDDTPCSGAGTCTGKGQYRCADDGTTACTADSDCGSSYCLADSDRISTLAATLSGYGSTAEVSTSDVSSMLASLGNFDSTVTELDAATTSINSAQNGIDAFSVQDSVDLITEMQDSINALNISDLILQVKDAQQQMADLNVSEEVEPYKDYGKHQRRANKEMSDAVYDIIAIKEFFVNSASPLKALYLNLAEANLESVYDAEGPSGMGRYVIAQVDSLNNYFADHVHVLFNVSRVNNTNEADDRLRILDKMGGYPQAGYGDMRENGALYYLFRFFNVRTILAFNPKRMGVFVDTDYEKYPDDQTCITESCEEHTLDVIHNDPLSDWGKEIPGLEIGIDYTLGELLLLMWVPPLLTTFFAVCTALLNFKVYKERARKVCSFMYMSCVICQIPFVLILTAMLFPMTIVLSDMCTTGAHVGASYLVAYGDPLCTELMSGVGTVHACDIVVDTVGDENITITVDALGMYNSFIGGECSGEDPFASIMDTLAAEIVDQPTEALNDWLEDNEDLELRKPVVDLMKEAAANQGNSLSTFFNLVGENIFNCGRFAGIANGLYGATCGSFVHPFLWLVGSWYLVGWTLVCCAFPAGCLKKKYNLIDEGAGEGEGGPGGDQEVEMVHAHPVAEVEDGRRKSNASVQSHSPRAVHSGQSTPRKSPRRNSGDRIEVPGHNKVVPLSARSNDGGEQMV